MKLTIKLLKEKSACLEGVTWFKAQEEADTVKVLRKLIDEEKYDWANWLFTRIATRPQKLAYAIFAAEQVIDIYEKNYPGKDKPRKAINAARKVLENDTEDNRALAKAAAAAAYAAAAADAAYAAAAYAAAAYADAAYAADAADAADAAYAADARKKNQMETADICRALLTEAVFEKLKI